MPAVIYICPAEGKWALFKAEEGAWESCLAWLRVGFPEWKSMETGLFIEVVGLFQSLKLEAVH